MMVVFIAEDRFYPGRFKVSDADEFIAPHAVHWLVCIEAYKSPRRNVLDYTWELVYGDVETCVYGRFNSLIIGFRGTKEGKDLYDDALISFNSSYPRSRAGVSLVSTFLERNPSVSIQLCGHSLGGAIARDVGRVLNLPVVTFNAASPPTAPAISNYNEIDYHIVYDIISAWQGPNTIRIDKGYRPLPVYWWQTLTYVTWLHASFSDVLESHKLANFSNVRPGKIICGEQEARLMNSWLSSLPAALRQFVYLAVFGVSGRFGLPPMEGCFGLELNRYT